MGENFVISFGYYKTQSNKFCDRVLKLIYNNFLTQETMEWAKESDQT
jgi:hypothetical protein